MDHGGQTTKGNFEMWNYEQKGALFLPRDCLRPSSDRATPLPKRRLISWGRWKMVELLFYGDLLVLLVHSL